MVTHGGDIQSFVEQYGFSPLDFSSNVSPLGVPERVVNAVREAADKTDAYPDRYCRRLRKALAEKERVPAERIVCGNGAADLIWRVVLALKPKKALLCAPCFGEYEAALRTAGAEIDTVPLTDAFRLPDTFFEAVTADTDLVMLSQPNNPSGVPLSPETVRKLLERCRETKTVLMLDECFTGFMDDPEAASAKRYLTEYDGLLVLNAFTKLYGMAGLRLGWLLCGSEDPAKRVAETGQAWSVSGVAQEAGVAALADTDYVARVRELVMRERARMYRALREMGLQVAEGAANFLLFRCALSENELSRGDMSLKEALRERGILIRSCGDFKGLDDAWYRVAVRTEEENMRLLAAIKEVTG